MLFFLDIETTGLDEIKNDMLEISCLSTVGEYVMGKVTHTIKPKNTDWQDQMDDFVREMHIKNGLLEEIENNGVSIEDAEKAVMDFVVGQKGEDIATMAGNSIHFDRRFIHKQMPKLDAVFHYRLFDVSSITTLAKMHWPEIVVKPEPAHRAFDDALRSFETYKYYADKLCGRR